MTDSAFPDRLTQLKSRWESDPSSRIFLQLAEEYRHQGRVKEALSVLDRGLREHPGYLSALVAKGRCHLELGEPEPARAVLERVVKQDPTQMVANKLLVRAYLDTGEPEKARERLDLYSLLNDSDPEIEELRRRLRAMEPPQGTSTSGRPSTVGIVPPRPAGGDDIFDLGAPPAPSAQRAGEPFGDLWPPPARPAQGPPAASAAQPPEPPEPQEPADVLFPGLASRESRNRYLRALTSEGLFFPDLIAPAEAEPAAPAPEVPVAVPAPAAFEPATFEPEPFEPQHFEPAPFEPAHFEPEPAAEPIATATLGEIYLRQGHRDEAERIFREVLRREPESSAAREGLARLGPAAPAPSAAAAAAAATLLMPVISRVPPPPQPPALATVAAEPAPAPLPEPAQASAAAGRRLEARDLLSRFPAEAEAGAGAAKARKVFLLNSYLKRLRRGGERDVS
jgi:tetratricopeptide (TPR) repeat protein